MQIQLVPNPDYNGPRKAKNAGVTFKIYQNDDAAYQDLLSNNLDVLQTHPHQRAEELQVRPRRPHHQQAVRRQPDHRHPGIPARVERRSGQAAPPGHLHGHQPRRDHQGDLQRCPHAGQGLHRPGARRLQRLHPRFGEPEVRRRQGQGSCGPRPTPSRSGTPTKTFTIAYNADKGGHKAWVEAVVNQLKNTLGIKVEGKPYATFKEARNDATAKTLTGSIRAGWQADYPSLYNFLGPIYKTGAGSNDADYSNPAFDKAVSDGLNASSVSEGNKAMNKAQEILFQDLPAIPLWYQVAQGGWSDKVTNVDYGWNGVPLYYNITGK